MPSPAPKPLTPSQRAQKGETSLFIEWCRQDSNIWLCNSILLLGFRTCFTCLVRFISAAVDGSRRSPELIQLLDMHTHFSIGSPGFKVYISQIFPFLEIYYLKCCELRGGGGGLPCKKKKFSITLCPVVKFSLTVLINIQGGREGVLHRPVTKCDAGTQTDTHLMDSNIVKSYEWNEWELRRKAIKLVCKTNLVAS